MKILVIRRDNIGDLVCTTPLLSALREQYPSARIDALVNSYNRAVLAHNPDIDHLYAYTKAKHREVNETVLGVYWRRFRLLMTLRAVRYDYVILANGGYIEQSLRLARWVRAEKTIGFVPEPVPRGTVVSIPISIDRRPRHEVENIFRLLEPLGVIGNPPKLCLQPDPVQKEVAEQSLRAKFWYHKERETVAIHISARKLLQRWPAENFVQLMRQLYAERQCQFVLFWSPGDESNPLHPGDDNKAASILAACEGLPILPYPTEQLEELIGGLSICNTMVCSDGGAMHIGAALGLPILCFFGNSDPCTWHPWGVPHEVLQAPSRKVVDISVDDAVLAFQRLM